MWLLMGLALGDAGSKTCVMRGLPLRLMWTEEGAVKVYDGDDLLVAANVGQMKGTTTATCKPEAVKFLTDTHARPGGLSLKTVTMGLSEILDTLNPDRFQRIKPTPRAPRPVPKRAPAKPAPQEDVELAVVEACLQTSVWSAHEEGWRMRSLTKERTSSEGRSSYALSLLAGNSYRVFVCAQTGGLEVKLADATGQVWEVAETEGRATELLYGVEASGLFYVVVDGAAEDAVGVAVVAR